ncbi:MAG TPA: DUF2127 domain-containing protein [Humisphaera sp.]|jgi:uncharacterized membrane protein (DUF2068 family)|nr:DUF2127 domain-containing protein [Humisphaera sp.]
MGHSHGDFAPLETRKPPLGALAWIATYKLMKALLALGAALLFLHLLHRDLVDVTDKWIKFFGIDRQGHLATHIVERVARINTRHFQFLVAILFTYMCIYIVEGVGLFMRKRWAEWLTVAQTALLIPWEAYELARKVDWMRAIFLILNIGVVIYLIWRLRRDERVAAAATARAGAQPPAPPARHAPR